MPDHDPAAVEAAKEINSCLPNGFSTEFIENRIDLYTRIIIEAYKPRLTAEREVREKLVEAIEAFTSKCHWDEKAKTWGYPLDIDMEITVHQMTSALAEADKLEKCR